MKIIKNGQLVYSTHIIKSDIAFEGEVITKIAANIESQTGDEVIDASGCFVFPGFIDGHTHLDMGTVTSHTADDFYTGTKAAISNGTTSIVDFATQEKGKTLLSAYMIWNEKAMNKSCCDYRFHMAITDFREDIKEEIKRMKEYGVTSFKMYMAYDNLYSNDQQIMECLQIVKEVNGVLGVHCENGKIINTLQKDVYNSGIHSPKGHEISRPPEVEAEAINRFAYIAEIVDYPIQIVHLSTKMGLEEVRKARKRNVKVYAETCPQYLLLDKSVYDAEDFTGAKYVMSPPLRTKEDQEALKEAIINQEIDTIATDHCSFNYKTDKILGKDDFRKIPNGAPGIEHRPLLVYTYLVKNKQIDISRMCSLLSETPARRYGMYPKKGVLKVGSDADIVIFNPHHNSVIEAKHQLQNVDYNIYEKMPVSGQVKDVFLRGHQVVKQTQIIQECIGKYIKK